MKDHIKKKKSKKANMPLSPVAGYENFYDFSRKVTKIAGADAPKQRVESPKKIKAVKEPSISPQRYV